MKKEKAPVVLNITPEELMEKTKIHVQGALHKLRQLEAFIGAMLQSLDISYDVRVGTLGVTISKESAEWKLIINPVFFSLMINDKNRLAVMTHEVYHILTGHLARIPFFPGIDPQLKGKLNFAADAEINQLIKGLPEGCVDITKMKWKDGNGVMQPYPLLKSFETYFKMLPDDVDYSGQGQGDKEGFGEGEGKGDRQCQECGGSGKNEDGSECDHCKGSGKEPCKACGGSGQGKDGEQCGHCKGSGHEPGMGKVLDNHKEWEEAQKMDEGEMIKATERIIERTLQKQNFSHSNLPDFVKDFLKYATARKKELNYKALLNKALRKSLAGLGRKSTWKRPNRKYGETSKGTKPGETPSLHIFIDTSGSISVEEVNTFLGIVKGFTKTTGNDSMVSFFHTKVYGTRKMSRSSVIKEGTLESGGTELTPVLRMIAKTSPELSIILTDGYYDNVRFENMTANGRKFPPTCFVVTREGQENHPLKRLGTTIKMPSKE